MIAASSGRASDACLQIPDGLIQPVLPEVDPSQRVDHVPVSRLQRERLFDHPLRLVEVDTAVRVEVSDEIERVRMIGIELQDRLHRGNAFLKTAGLFEEDAETVVEIDAVGVV